MIYKVRKIFCGIFLSTVLSTFIAVDSFCADVEIKEKLASTTKRRDDLRDEVKNAAVKLEGAQSKLQDLIRRQSPYADIQLQKERIRGMQRDKLKLLTKLLATEELRVGLLLKIKRATTNANTVNDTSRVDDKSKVKVDALTKRIKNRSIPVARESDFGMPTYDGIAVDSVDSSAAMNKFKKALALVKAEKIRIDADLQAYTTRRLEAEEKLKKLPASAVSARKALSLKIKGYKLTESTLRGKKKNLMGKLFKLQMDFEKYVSSRNDDDFIMPGQRLELIVAEDKSFNGTYTVRQGGYLVLPRVGRIAVAGKTREDAEQAVKDVLEKTQLRIATVLLESARMDDPKKQTEELQREYLKARIKSLTREDADIGQDVIYLTGTFKKNGPWAIPKNFKPTLLTTIIRSGGVLDKADMSRVRILRMINGKSKTETIDVKGMMEGKPGIMDVKLLPNDVIIIPESSKKKLQTVYLTGSVKKPGAFEINFDKRTTVYTVILKAGGFSRFANLSKVYVLRSGSDGKKNKITVDLKKVKNGEIADPELHANDIIVVPESFWGTGN